MDRHLLIYRILRLLTHVVHRYNGILEESICQEYYSTVLINMAILSHYRAFNDIFSFFIIFSERFGTESTNVLYESSFYQNTQICLAIQQRNKCFLATIGLHVARGTTGSIASRLVYQNNRLSRKQDWLEDTAFYS